MIEEAPKAIQTYQETKKTINYSPRTCQDTVGSWNRVWYQPEEDVWCNIHGPVSCFSLYSLFVSYLKLHFPNTSRCGKDVCKLVVLQIHTSCDVVEVDIVIWVVLAPQFPILEE
jgi:hypothetical protein